MVGRVGYGMVWYGMVGGYGMVMPALPCSPFTIVSSRLTEILNAAAGNGSETVEGKL